MQLQLVDDPAGITESRPIDVMSFNFVNKLLMTMLGPMNNKLIFEPQEIINDTKIGIRTDGSLITKIDCNEMVTTDVNVEITISGTVENDYKQKERFTLFFSLWADIYTIASINTSCGKTIGTNHPQLNLTHTDEMLSDSVFKLDIYQKDPARSLHPTGSGRGYLVFGNS